MYSIFHLVVNEIGLDGGIFQSSTVIPMLQDFSAQEKDCKSHIDHHLSE